MFAILKAKHAVCLPCQALDLVEFGVELCPAIKVFDFLAPATDCEVEYSVILLVSQNPKTPQTVAKIIRRVWREDIPSDGLNQHNPVDLLKCKELTESTRVVVGILFVAEFCINAPVKGLCQSEDDSDLAV